MPQGSVSWRGDSSFGVGQDGVIGRRKVDRKCSSTGGIFATGGGKEKKRVMDEGDGKSADARWRREVGFGGVGWRES
jgi:hypothetical protein